MGLDGGVWWVLMEGSSIGVVFVAHGKLNFELRIRTLNFFLIEILSSRDHCLSRKGTGDDQGRCQVSSSSAKALTSASLFPRERERGWKLSHLGHFHLSSCPRLVVLNLAAKYILTLEISLSRHIGLFPSTINKCPGLLHLSASSPCSSLHCCIH